MLINLWVRDKSTGDIHQVGTDIHDSVVGMDNGMPTYYNLQNGDGTGEGGGYEWVEPQDLDDYVLVTPELLHLHREKVHEDVLKIIREGSKKDEV